jgi:hypothetical protein
MTTFTTGLPDNDNHNTSNDSEPGSPENSNLKLPLFRELFSHHSRLDLLTKSLIRIIGMIVITGAIVGLYEWLG